MLAKPEGVPEPVHFARAGLGMPGGHRVDHGAQDEPSHLDLFMAVIL